MRCVSATILLAMLSGGAAAPVADKVHVETIDARSLEGRLVSITAEAAVLEVEGSARTLAPADLAEIVLADAADPMAGKGRLVVATRSGEHMVADGLRVKDRRISFTSPLVGKVSIPLSTAAAVYLPGPGRSPGDVWRKCEQLEIGPSAQDVVVVVRPAGGWMGIEGILKAVDDKSATFTWKGTDRKISRGNIRAIFLAWTGSSAADRKGVLIGTDGSAVSFSSLTFADGVFTVGIAGADTAKIPRDKVAAVRFTSRRVVDLGDLKPESVKEYGFLDCVIPHRINQSAAGRSIKLGGRSYSTGLGLHSFCELTYSLGEGYSGFVATVGIDDAVRPGGDARLVFLGDGRELAAPLRLTGRDEPRTVRLKLKGVKTLTIRAEFGEDGLDVGDHVDLAGARLIK